MLIWGNFHMTPKQQVNQDIFIYFQNATEALQSLGPELPVQWVGVPAESHEAGTGRIIGGHAAHCSTLMFFHPPWALWESCSVEFTKAAWALARYSQSSFQ